ncbi:hypothetical protein RB213_007986, partial [Colletotrichum asianum]
KFQLIPVREISVPSRFRLAEFPPSSEVYSGNYAYLPVPMDDAEMSSIPLRHLTEPGAHSDKFWITTFPKKLKSQLYRYPGSNDRPVIGWGVRVNEALNWSHLLFLVFTMTLTIGVILGIYRAVKSDYSSTFGLGAMLVALVALYILCQYHAWKESLE